MATPRVTRKNAASLTPAEKTRFVNAVKTLNNHDSLSAGSVTVPSASSIYRKFMTTHNDIVAGMPSSPLGTGPISSFYAHGNILFLAWHRILLYEFELALRKADVFNGSITKSNLAIPYWNWNIQRSTIAGVAGGELWANTFMGPSGDPTAGNRLQEGPFKEGDFEVLDSAGRTAIMRAFGTAGALSTRADVDHALQCHLFDIADFDRAVLALPTSPSPPPYDTGSFRSTLERLNHNQVHNWAAGSLSNVYTSPNDPLFYLLHCNVDRLWKSWQIQHLGAAVGPNLPGVYHTLQDQYPNVTGSSNTNALDLTTNLSPWNGAVPGYARTWNTAEVLNWQKIGTRKSVAVPAFATEAHDYLYDDDPPGTTIP